MWTMQGFTHPHIYKEGASMLGAEATSDTTECALPARVAGVELYKSLPCSAQTQQKFQVL